MLAGWVWGREEGGLTCVHVDYYTPKDLVLFSLLDFAMGILLCSMALFFFSRRYT
jgi:hypothetical protein